MEEEETMLAQALAQFCVDYCLRYKVDIEDLTNVVRDQSLVLIAGIIMEEAEESRRKIQNRVFQLFDHLLKVNYN